MYKFPEWRSRLTVAVLGLGLTSLGGLVQALYLGRFYSQELDYADSEIGQNVSALQLRRARLVPGATWSILGFVMSWRCSTAPSVGRGCSTGLASCVCTGWSTCVGG